MDWLQKIQNKPQAEKLRIIWATVIVVAILLVGVWIISARYYKNVPKDNTLFNTIGQGIHDVNESLKKK